MFFGYEEHWLLGQYLQGDEPDWGGLAFEENIDALSGGEKVLLDFAGAFHNVFDVAYLDDAHRDRVLLALNLWAVG